MFGGCLVCRLLLLWITVVGGRSKNGLLQVSGWWSILVSRDLAMQLSVLFIVFADVVKSQIEIVTPVSLALVDRDGACTRGIWIFLLIHILLLLSKLLEPLNVLLSTLIMLRMIHLNRLWCRLLTKLFRWSSNLDDWGRLIKCITEVFADPHID